MTVTSHSISYPYFMISQFVLVLCAIGGSWIAASATQGSTEKDYVGLAITVLQSPDSPRAQRVWAAEILDKLSPVSIPAALKGELATGKSNLPAECVARVRVGEGFKSSKIPDNSSETTGDIVRRMMLLETELKIAHVRLDYIRDQLSICDGSQSKKNSTAEI